MAVSTPYRGTTYLIPETDEEDWGDTVTNLLVAIATAANLFQFTSAALNPVGKESAGADLTIAAAGTITWTHNLHVISGDGGAVTVDSTTGIAAGEADWQGLTLVGGHATNTVRIEDAGNTSPNGAVVLGLGHMIHFLWDDDNSNWLEAWRSH